MTYKKLSNNQVSHNVYPIVKTSQFLQRNNQEYSKYIHHNTTPSELQLYGIKRFIKNNNTYLFTQQGFFNTFQGNKLNSQIFANVSGSIQLNIYSIQAITYIREIISSQYIKLLLLSNYQIVDNNIYQLVQNKFVAQYIPQLSLILWKHYEQNQKDITIQHSFSIHQFQYLCSISPSQMNRTNNKTAYNEDQLFNNDITNLYISSIGLYDSQNTLLAIAKLSSPIRVSNKINTNILIQLDYTI